MKKSWKPQIRSFWMNKPPFWLAYGLVSICFALFLLINSNDLGALFVIIIFLASLIAEIYKLKIWKTVGYEKITIDTDKKLVVFDDNLMIPFNKINDITYSIENNPNKDLYMRKSIFDNGRMDMTNINANLCITSSVCYDINFSIQNKTAANQILKTLKKAGFSIINYDERTFDFGLLGRILYILAAVLICFFIFLNSK